MSRSTHTCLHLFPPTLFLPTLLFIAPNCIFSRLRFLLVFLASHKSIPVSSSFFNFLCLNYTSYSYAHWMICQPNVFVFSQTFLHQGPLSQTGRVCTLPLRKCGLWHNPGKAYKAPLCIISYIIHEISEMLRT